VHSNHEAATVAFSARPFFDERIDLLPTAKIEVSDAEIRPIGNFDGLSKGGQKLLFDVVEYSRHRGPHQAISRKTPFCVAARIFHGLGFAHTPILPLSGRLRPVGDRAYRSAGRAVRFFFDSSMAFSIKRSAVFAFMGGKGSSHST
jgi:hypothetical protein